MKLALLIVVAAMSPTALAGDIYKCQDAAGKIEFRDRPCDATQKAQKVDITPNSVETMTLEEVRAKSAELKAKQQARQDAENKANADAYAAQERRGSRSVHSKTRSTCSRLSAIAGRMQRRLSITTATMPGNHCGPLPRPSPPPPPPKAPAMPTPPPKPPGG